MSQGRDQLGYPGLRRGRPSFNWKKKYAGLLPLELLRLRELEDENGQLKRTVAGLTLDREMLQDVVKRKL